MTETLQLGWTQPACAGCFARHNPGRHPLLFTDPDNETCCYCGTPTTSGIYVRVDPTTVDHPTHEKE